MGWVAEGRGWALAKGAPAPAAEQARSSHWAPSGRPMHCLARPHRAIVCSHSRVSKKVSTPRTGCALASIQPPCVSPQPRNGCLHPAEELRAKMQTFSRMRPASVSHRAVRTRAVAPPEYDMEVSGLKHLSDSARELATQKKINNFEKVKNKKCGSKMWTEVHELSAMLKEGKYTFEELDLDDVDIRLKWAGLFHRKKRTPGKFMMRLKVWLIPPEAAQGLRAQR